MAIAALPPLNGFVSEWLIFQSVLVSPVLPQWPVKLLAPAAGVALALSAALSAAVFVRLYGVAFLSRPRSQAAAEAREADRFSLIAMGALLALCIVAGLAPGLLMDAMRPLALTLTGAAPPQQIASAFLTLTPIAENRSSYNAPLILGFVLVAAALTSGLMHRFGSRLLRRTPAWDCGYPETSAAAQYTAASFAQPIRRAFSGVAFSAREEIDMPEPLDKRAARLSWRVRDIIWERLYAPLGAAFEGAALLFNRTHFWTVRAYLSLMFAALVVLLIAVALWN
jgi:formate hydrogenlyase subunit 3/multisubunit Na+/H+ antiporter MnhD subunit